MSILVVDSVHKSFREGFWGRRKRVLEGVSLSVREGEVYGFLGHNGAGKSTTMKVILGLVRSDSGRVEVFGGPPDDKKIRDRVGFLSEEIGLYPHMSAEENLHLVGELHRLRGSRLRGRTDELIAAVGLAGARGVRVKDYSKGMRQRLGIAAALMNNPDLLLLDEPYSGLDPVGRKDLRQLLLALKAEGTTIMLSSHIVPDVEAVCDRVGILSRGTVTRELDLRKVFDGTGKIVEVTVAGLHGDGLDPADYAGERVGDGGDTLVVRCPGDEHLKALVNDVYASNGSIVEVRRMRPNLEDVFVEEIDRVPGDDNNTDLERLTGADLIHAR
jgi:ABC-2 type transport system ATP-binding protein